MGITAKDRLLAQSRKAKGEPRHRQWRTTHAYKRMRRRYLAASPLCAKCAEAGFTVAATELDHIVPASVAPDRFWDPGNLQGLCRACHEEKTREENTNRDAFDERFDTISEEWRNEE